MFYNRARRRSLTGRLRLPGTQAGSLPVTVTRGRPAAERPEPDDQHKLVIIVPGDFTLELENHDFSRDRWRASAPGVARAGPAGPGAPA
jgi:hypothetical protein